MWIEVWPSACSPALTKSEVHLIFVFIEAQAEQIHEAASLVVRRSGVEKLILVGDPRQLPAVGEL